MNEGIEKLEIQRDFKSNSSSSIYLTSTINYPNAKLIIKAVSSILQSQLLEDMQLGKTISEKSDLYFFSEEKYVSEFPSSFDDDKVKFIKKNPTLEEINDFIEALYNCAQFSPECCILFLIYINRIIALTGLSLQTSNWRPLILISIMISQKVWDDKYLCNEDFSYIFPFFNIEQMNTLEMKFLEMIQYNLYVKDSLYIKYYLELKKLVADDIPFRPMNLFTLKKLESQSKKMEKNLKKNSKTVGESKQFGQFTNVIIN